MVCASSAASRLSTRDASEPLVTTRTPPHLSAVQHTCYTSSKCRWGGDFLVESRRTQQRRREAAKAKLVAATISLIGEHGLRGFSVSDVAERSGLDRGLVGHHFKTIRALTQAAAETCILEEDAGASERGLDPMLGWIEAQLARAVARDPRLLATLQIAFGPGAEAFGELRSAYWRQQCEWLQLHLSTAKALQQISADLDPAEAASFVLAALHGEQLRIIATGQPPPPRFADVLRRALVATPPPKPGRKSTTAKDAALDLFNTPGR